MEKIRSLIEKYSQVIKYFIISCGTAVIELCIGLLLINLLHLSEVVSNTAGILIGSAIHYVCVTKKVFDRSVDIRTVVIYISTFLLGMLIQNGVVWAVCRLLDSVVGKSIGYTVSKVASLAVSFFVLYGVRKFLYAKVTPRDNKDNK